MTAQPTNSLRCIADTVWGGAKFTSSDEIQVGDEIIVYGELTMYGTTPEVTQGSKIYYLNGVTADVGDVGDHELVGNGTVDNPYTATDALWLANSGSYTSSKVYVKGIISGDPEIDTSYGNATYYISDDGTTTNRFEIYRGYSLGGAKFTSKDEIKAGDEVIVYGEITMYYTTPEMTTGSSIYYLNGVTADVGDVGDHELVGDGTVDNPYTAADANWLATSGTYTDDEVYVKGIISQIDEISTSYGNATYYISDDGTTDEQFEIYRGYGLGGAKFTSEDEIKVGDEVIVYGELTMYGTTPEMTTGSSIYYLNGVTADVGDVGDHELVGDGTADNPYTATDALWLANDGSYTSDKVYVKGIISGDPEIDTSYGNATYYISDDGSTTNRFEIYRGYSLGGAKFTSTDEIKEGDEVIVYGEITMYYTTPEMTTGSSIYYLNGVTADVGDVGDHELEGDGTVNNPYTATDALWLANSGSYTSDNVYVKGIISSITEVDTSYGNATYYISDDGTTTNQFYIYRGYSLGGAKFTSTDEIKVGDEVIVYGVITMYYTTPEMTQYNSIYSLNGVTSSTGDTGDLTGNGTVDNPYTTADALAIINAGTYTSSKVYVSGIISQIDEIDTGTYGNATYYISDDGTTTNHLEVYRGYSLGGEKFTSSDEIKVGDEVIVYGELTMFYSTPEITTGSSIYSLNGEISEGGDSGDTGDLDLKGSGTLDDPYTASDAIAIIANNSSYDQNVYITGTVSQIGSVNSYNELNYYISDDGTTDNQLYVYGGLGLGGEGITSASYLTLGDVLVICGELKAYNGSAEVNYGSTIYSINGQTYEAPEVDESDPFVQNVTWENVSSSNCSYSESAYINGSTTAYNFCRVGKSGTIGHATCKVPAGTKALHFYCIAWNNGGPAPFTVTVGSTAYDSYTATAHSGLANSSPYTIDDVTDSDYFEITFDELSAETEVKVETTSSSKPRVGFIGFKYVTD